MERDVTNGLMELYMMGNGKIICIMEKEHIHIKMEGDMREIGLKEKCMERVITFGRMVNSIKDNTKII